MALIRTTILTDASGVFTIGEMTSQIKIRGVGGGGGGGGISGASNSGGAGGGGSSGGYVEATFNVFPSAECRYACGAGGIGGVAGEGNSGYTGDDSTFAVNDVIVTCHGGPGGHGTGASPGWTVCRGGHLENPSTYGDLNGYANPGGTGMSYGQFSFAISGAGGAGPFGGGAPSILMTDGQSAGYAGVGYGSGGSGAYSTAANKNGGAGANGCWIIEEYSDRGIIPS